MKHILTIILSLIIGWQLGAQSVQDSTRQEKIQASSDHAWFERKDTSNIQYLIGDVKIYHDSTYMYCDSAIINGQQLKAIGNVVILQNDSLQIFADTLYYNGDSLKSELINNVVLQKAKKKMYSNHIYYNMESKIASFYDTASFFLETTKLKSVKGFYDTKMNKATFIEKVNMIDESFQLRTDTLDFYTSEERMVFRAPTRMDKGTKKIYCESGFYDTKAGISSFEKNAQFQDTNTEATADKILYHTKNQKIQLIGNAYFKDETQTATAKKIVYNKALKTFDLYGDADYSNGEKRIVGDVIHYNETTENMTTKGRSIIDEPDSHLEADHIDFDKVKGVGNAIGKVIYKDKKSNINVYGEKMEITDNNNRVKIYDVNKQALLESIIDQDTMFLTADTLYTINKKDSTGNEYKLIRAYNNVQIFKSDIQAISDSLTYNTRTEKISLYTNPIMWSDTSQFTGDTIHLQLKENKINKVILSKNAFISQSQDEQYFSQISGKTIVITFNDTTISRMQVLGNAESIYYMTDESKKYTGVTKTICSNIQFDFQSGELSRSKFSPKPNTEILPMLTTDHNEIKLKAFSWEVDKRPKNKEDILKSPESSIFIKQIE